MYQSLEASLHDLFWRAESEADETPLLEEFLRKHPGKSLEVGCGSGRLMLDLLEKGFDIEGVELSADMVQLLNEDANKRGLTPIVHHTAIEQFETNSIFSAITIPAFTLQLLSREKAQQVLTSLRSLTKPKGGIYLTLFIPWSEILDELEIDVWHLDKEAQLPNGQNAKCFTRHSINRLMQELHREHRYEVGETKHFSEQTLQWYFLPELIKMLDTSGWTFVNFDSNFQQGEQDADACVITLYAIAS